MICCSRRASKSSLYVFTLLTFKIFTIVCDTWYAGVDVSGKIALVKYGRGFRGLKVKGKVSCYCSIKPVLNIYLAAQEAGAVGCIIFTDPGDDGEMTEENGYEQYPNGPARQPSSVQRGSVQFVGSRPSTIPTDH